MSNFPFLLHLHFQFLTQTLTTLDLGTNEIGESGAQYVAKILENNMVDVFSFYLYCLHLVFLTQTLTTLILVDSKIGDNGVQYLADALQNNTVNILCVSSLSVASFLSYIDTENAQPQKQ